MRRHVAIGSTKENIITDSDSRYERRFQKTMSLTRIEQEYPCSTDPTGQPAFTTYEVEGDGQMTRFEADTKRATLYSTRNPSQMIYMERGEGEDILILATKNNQQ